MHKISVLALLALPLACMTACGDDSEDKIFSNGGSSGSGGKSGAGASGKGGSSGSIGASGSTSTGGSIAAGSGGSAAGSGGDAGSAGAAEGGTSSGGQSGSAGSAGTSAGQGGTSGSTGAGGVPGEGGAGSGGLSGAAGSGNAGTSGSSAGNAGASGSSGEGGSSAGTAGAGGDSAAGKPGTGGAAGSGSTDKTVVINEVCTVKPDHLEFRNVTGSPIDISGWYFTDSEPEKDGHTYTFPPGTIINDLLVLYEAPKEGQLALTIGLGEIDAVKLYDKSKTLQDQHSWSAHVNTASRCPTASEPIIGEFKIAPASAGEPNKCE